MRFFTICMLLLLSTPPTTFAKKSTPAKQTLPGPIPAKVIKIIDGDTVAVRAHIWVDQSVNVLVRVADVDTPELSGRCPEERAKARAARKFVARKIAAKTIMLVDIRQGKYAGRIIAKIKTSTGEDLSTTLLKNGHARPFNKRRDVNWCCADDHCAKKSTRLSQTKNYQGLGD